MKAYKVNPDQMEQALLKVNEKYQGNVIWKRFESNGSGVHFTLTVNSSRRPGGRIGQSGMMGYGPRKHVAAACWHVHGDFFDALFDIAPEAYVRSMGKRIDKHQGNWEDRNIGSQMSPVYYSEACDCHKMEQTSLAQG